ncbi:MAG TPA: MFS transporter [Caldithrix abyssi]|uniref:MFS transporter n=1 Tax=Caldithrix abyssi TaxID=187145 RepID=A0A7V5LIX8_CALAY|nr:MFS transporter [Caldithrix abyssi]
MKNSRKYVVFVAGVAALGGFLFGFDTAVISGAEKSIQELWNLNGFWHGFTVAIALIGTVIGAIIAGKPADLFGRKKVLFYIGVFYALSAIGSALAFHWYLFLIARFLGGLGIGASSVVAPMYISEIAPSHLRGRLVALFQLNVVTGIMISFFSNYIIAQIFANDAWRWMLGVAFIPSLLFLIMVIFIPNSPRWLVKQGRNDEAKQVLVSIGEKNVEEEMADIIQSLQFEKESGTERLFQKKYRKPILYAVLIAAFNQLSGINALMYFAPRIFEMAGLAKSAALLQSAAIGFTNLIFTILAMTIIDKFGRKTLLIIGSFGMIFSLGMVSRIFFVEDFGGYSVLIYLLIFIAFFAFSQGAVIWVFISEIFPNKVRAKGQALGSFTHWFGAAIISWLFPIIAEHESIGGGYAFMFFSLMMVLHLFFAWKVIPETKGKSLEEIEIELHLTA